MECPKTNSSEEEIKSVQSSLNMDILNNYEEKPRKHHRHYKSKNEHRSRRNNQRKKSSDGSRAFVRQDIHVERQDFQCLNTTVCDHGNSHHGSCDEKYPEYKYKRTVPHCLRQSCHKSNHRQTQFRHSKEHCTVSFLAKIYSIFLTNSNN